MRNLNKLALTLFLGISVLSCSVSPEPINFGEDHCAHCKMKIVDPKFGGELVTRKGRIYKFDALECLIPYLDENNVTEYAHVLAIAYDFPKTLFNVNELGFEIDPAYNSPMGMNLAALGNPDNGKSKALMNWESIQKQIAASNFQLVAP